MELWSQNVGSGAELRKRAIMAAKAVVLEVPPFHGSYGCSHVEELEKFEASPLGT